MNNLRPNSNPGHGNPYGYNCWYRDYDSRNNYNCIKPGLYPFDSSDKYVLDRIYFQSMSWDNPWCAKYLQGVLVGIGLPFIDHGDDKIPSETIDSSCPHNDYKSRGKKPEGLEVGLLGKMGMELFSTNVYMSIIGGMTRVHEIHLTQSIL